MKKLIILTLAVIFAIPLMSQNGIYKSNFLVNTVWDYSSQQYVPTDTVKNMYWKVYFCPSEGYSAILCNEKVIGYEEIKLAEKKDGTKIYDGNKGARILYFKKDNVFLIFYNKDSNGRYRDMYVLSGIFTKMSKKKLKESFLKEDLFETPGNEIKI